MRRAALLLCLLLAPSPTFREELVDELDDFAPLVIEDYL